jgi:quercetin dioxygenase-like cupin family protein
MIAFVHAPTLVGIGIGVALSRVSSWLSLPRWLQSPRKQGFRAVHSESVQWDRNQAAQSVVTYFIRPLFEDQRTGDRVLLVRYPPGEINPSHFHPAAHGMYVLKGTLVTHLGTFGPGTYVWFPPYEVMWHGATRDQEVVVLFMAGRNLSTHYTKATEVPRPVPRSA